MRTTWLDKLIFVFIAVFVVGGNALGFLVAGRVSFKVGEILGIIVGLCMIRNFFSEQLETSVSILLGWGVLSCILLMGNTLYYSFSFGDLVTALLYLFRFVYFLLLAYVIARHLIRSHLLDQTLIFLNGCYLVVCLIGLVQFVVWPVAFDFYEIFYSFGVYFPNPDPHVNRLLSTYFDPNYLSSCLLIGVVINLRLLETSFRTGKKNRWKYIVFLAIYLFTILLTKSRSGMLGLFIIAAFCGASLLRGYRIRIYQLILALCVLVALLCVVFFSNITVFVRMRAFLSDPSALARFSSWKKGLQTVVDTNFLGLGYNLYGSYNRLIYENGIESTMYGMDASLILIVITTGLIGIVLWMIHFVSIFKIRTNALFIRSLLTAALVICWFNNLLFYSLWVFPFYLCVYLLSENAGKRHTAKTMLLKERTA